jgi:glyoxylase-like metal-dependent hydrolase (beta-lactamase superfamily II)
MLLGDYRVEIVPDTEFRLDGGAMFGVVPRKLWAWECPPDDDNRIRMNMNCVFIDTGTEKILIETGIGDKWTAKQTSMYGIDRVRPLDETLKMRTGVAADEITIVVNTHLHFDHAGGNTRLDASGKAMPAFPNARYFVSGAELDHAEHPSERDRASYLPENWRPVVESGQLERKDSDYEVVPGLRMETIAGHNRSTRWADDVWVRRSRADARARAFAVDSGLRPLSGGVSRGQEATVAAGSARTLALHVLSRS